MSIWNTLTWSTYCREIGVSQREPTVPRDHTKFWIPTNQRSWIPTNQICGIQKDRYSWPLSEQLQFLGVYMRAFKSPSVHACLSSPSYGDQHTRAFKSLPINCSLLTLFHTAICSTHVRWSLLKLKHEQPYRMNHRLLKAQMVYPLVVSSFRCITHAFVEVSAYKCRRSHTPLIKVAYTPKSSNIDACLSLSRVNIFSTLFLCNFRLSH